MHSSTCLVKTYLCTTHIHTHTTKTHLACFQSLRGGGIRSLLFRGATPRAACMMVMNFLYFMLLLINALSSQCLLVNLLTCQHLRLPMVEQPFLSVGIPGCGAEELKMPSESWMLSRGDRAAVRGKSQKQNSHVLIYVEASLLHNSHWKSHHRRIIVALSLWVLKVVIHHWFFGFF